MTHPSPKRNMVSKVVLMRSSIVSLTTARPVNTAQLKTTVNNARPMTNIFNKAHSTGNPKMDLQDQGVIDNGIYRTRKLMEDMLPLEVIPKEGKSQAEDETSGILKSFKTGVENLIDQRVKVIRCDNRTEFKNKEMNQFCERKGIKREFSVARTPQQNGVAERKNRTLIEAARTMLADSKLPTTFWAEAVNTACYADEGLFVGYSINSKTFRVFNSRTRIDEEIMHVQFSENAPNIAGSGPNWLFDIDALTKSMNYKPVVAGNQSNGNAGTKACDDAGDDGKKVDENPRKDSEGVDQEKDVNVNSTNNVNAASTNEVNVVGAKTSIKLPIDPDMHELEDIVYSDDDEDVGAEADMNNLNTFMPVNPIPTTRVHKDHPVEQIIR
ncbi:putative ribonuclease H-like domain-containing protein, partial [Tanacetum coccineum]